ncbi:MAG: hypothetical protein ABI844_06835 [Saprospiraceae bacterium]
MVHIKFNSFLIFTLVTVLIDSLFSQPFYNNIKSAELNGIGGQTVAHTSIESYAGNPSVLANLLFSSISINGENKFSGSGILGTNIFAGIKISESSGFGINYEYYGITAYHQSVFKAGYGMKLSKRLSLGASGSFIGFNNVQRESTSLGAFNMGSQYQLLDNLLIGISFHQSIINSSFKTQYLHSTALAGLAYKISSLVTLFTEVERQENFGANCKVGFQYQITTDFNIGAGINSSPSSFSTGIGYLLQDRLKLDATFSFYQSIGLTPSFSLRYFLKSKQIAE